MKTRNFANIEHQESRIKFYTSLELNPLFENTQKISPRKQDKINDSIHS